MMKIKRGYYDAFVDTCGKFPSRVAMRVYEDDVYKCYTYSELYGICEFIGQQLQKLNCCKSVIGLVSNTNMIVPCLAAISHKFCKSFMFLDPQQDINAILEEVKCSCVIAITQSDRSRNYLNKAPDKCFHIYNLYISIYDHSHLHKPTNRKNDDGKTNYSYIAMTSGSTGEPKKIQVPIQCLQPNINDLTNIFNISPDDVIYFSTPLTFDPSMVEILLASLNGASLLIAPARPDVLFPSNREHSVTVWQTTPSKFFQLTNAQMKNKVLSKNSTLRILALGGEPLHGIKRIKELKHSNNKTRLFTLYGVTEMSCWACVAELDLSKISTDSEVPLGKCLSETEIIVRPGRNAKPQGKIMLKSKTRQCMIMSRSNKNIQTKALKIIDTGDLGEVSPSGTIYYRGRRDDVIKRFGHKINLQFIESTVMQCPRIKACSCIWLPKPKQLVVYFTSETFASKDLSDFLRCKLDDKHWPDRIIRIDKMPLSKHGKMLKPIMVNTPEKDSSSMEPGPLHTLRFKFLQELKNVLKINVTYDQIKDKDFFSLGGTSFLAVAMCNNISNTYPNFGKGLLPAILNQNNTIDKCIQFAEQDICSLSSDNILDKRKIQNDGDSTTQPTKKFKDGETIQFKKKVSMISSDSLASSVSVQFKRKCNKYSSKPVEFIELWTYNTGKCVDASPAVLQTGLNLYMTVGSHSGKVVVMDTVTGLTVGVINMGSRIEASVCCYPGDMSIPPCGIVGAYDGSVVSFAIETCTELWRTNVGAMVKSKAVCCNGSAYVATYKGFVKCLDLKTGALKYIITVSDKAISADLILAKKEFIMVGTLSGECCSIHTASNSLAWRGTLQSPVFASPMIYDEEKYVVFAEVSGEIHCRTVEKGIKIWSFSGAKGNIFSSISIRQISKHKHQLIFGCHDKCLYCFNVKNFQTSMQWKVQLSAPVYSTPCFLTDRFILAATSDGKLTIMTVEYGVPVAECQLPGETFSTPALYKDYIFIGCRNDLVYAFKYLINT